MPQIEAPPIEKQSNNLGPLEISVERDEANNLAQRARFAGRERERAYWLNALPFVEDDAEKVTSFENCGRSPLIKYSPSTRTYRLEVFTCKLRICPGCRKRKQRSWRDRITALLEDEPERSWQMITLTVRHNDARLNTQLSRLRSFFRRLRQQKFWKDRIKQGYAVIEIGFNNDTQRWHPHLHILCKCKFIDYTQLRKAWFRITEGSHSINGTFVKTAAKAAQYVAKYLGKPPCDELFNQQQHAAEYYEALAGNRFIIPFGKPADRKPIPTLEKPPADFTLYQPLHVTVRNAKNGCEDAQLVLDSLGLTRLIFYNPPPTKTERQPLPP